MVSLGLSAISLIGLLIAVFTGVGMVSKEIDKRTLHAVLAKPLHRWEFLLGKFSGLVLTLTVNTAAMAAGLFLAMLVGEAFAGARRRGRARCGVLHFAETRAGGGAGNDVFLLYVAAAGDSVHRRSVHRGTVRVGAPQSADARS